MSTKIVYINLDSDMNRRDGMEKHLNLLGKKNYERFSAFRGEDITVKHNQKEKNTKGEYGCLYSHIAALKSQENVDDDYVLVLEDDARFLYNFDMNKLWSMVGKDVDIIQLYSNILNDELYKIIDKVNVTDTFLNWKHNMYGTLSYVIRKSSIPKITKYIDIENKVLDMTGYDKNLVADVVIYDSVKTVSLTSSLFYCEDYVSTIHPSHDSFNKKTMIKRLQIKPNNTLKKIFTHKDKITLCIKTFLRPQCLDNCISSFRKYYPDIHIIVADDSSDKYKKLNDSVVKKYNNVVKKDLPYDSGVCYGRNEIVKDVKTPYTLYVDDDTIFSEKTDVLHHLSFMENNPQYDMVCGVNSQRTGGFNRYKIKWVKKENNFYTIKGGKVDAVHFEKIKHPFLDTRITHLGFNQFIAKTSTLIQTPWVNEFKLREHTPFFCDWFIAGHKVANSDNFIFTENSLNLKYPEYNKHRWGEKCRRIPFKWV